MSETKGHDPQCPMPNYPYTCPRCALIARVRADEREQHHLCDCAVECIAKRSIINGALAGLRAKAEEWDKRYTLVEVSDVLALLEDAEMSPGRLVEALDEAYGRGRDDEANGAPTERLSE